MNEITSYVLNSGQHLTYIYHSAPSNHKSCCTSYTPSQVCC